MQRVQRQSFNPSEFDSSMNEYSEKEDDSIVTKGKKNTLKLDKEEFSEIIANFRKTPHKRIDELNDSESDNFKLIVRYVELLYDTDLYHHLFKIVEDHFSDLESVKPGTIGGYLAGCLIKTKFPIPGCSPVCANAIPFPKELEKQEQCDQAVILAEKNDTNGYKFNILKQADIENKDKPTIIHVNVTDVHDWSGFNKDEKEKLRSLGCSNVHIYGYSDDQTRHVDLFGAPINIDDVKTRNIHKSHERKDNIGFGVILIVIILIIIIALFGYRLWSNNNF